MSFRACLPVIVLAALLVPHASAQDSALASSSTPGAALRVQLHDVEEERASTTRLWPGLMMGAGVASVLTGAIVGIVHTTECRGSCSAPAWVSVLVVAGAGVAAVGTVWLVNVNHDIEQLDMKASMLRQDIERFSRRSALEQRELALGGRSPAFTLSLTF